MASTTKKSLFIIAALCVAIACVIALTRRPAVFYAVARGDLPALKAYLDAGGDPNATSWTIDGKVSGPRSLLYHAVRGGSPHTVAELLRRGATINMESSVGHPGLLAAYQDDREIVGLIIDSGIDPYESIGKRSGNGAFVTPPHNPMWSAAIYTQRWSAATAILIRKHPQYQYKNILHSLDWGNPSESRTLFIATLISLGLDVDEDIGDGLTIRAIATESEDAELLALIRAMEAHRAIKTKAAPDTVSDVTPE